MLRRSLALLSAQQPAIVGLKVLKGRKYLQATFKDAAEPSVLSAEYLRAYTTSAEALGHSATDKKKWPSGKSAVTIDKLWQVGNYAVTIGFSDGHSSGIYSWPHLHDLARNKYKFMRAYIVALREEKKSRHPVVVNRGYKESIMSKVSEKIRKKSA